MNQNPKLWVAGLGAQYPPHLLTPDVFEEFAFKHHDNKNPGLKKLCQINRHTGIETRASICNFKDGFGTLPEAPTIAEQDRFFRQSGVNLATQACMKALQEWAGNTDEITHTVAVTCTNQGNPGYDLLVHHELGLSPNVSRTLLHGVGCAGGLAILRTAAQLCDAATARGKPARILGFACELCTPVARQELVNVAEMPARDVGPAGVLFSDGAAAFVLCNTLGLRVETQPLFELVEFDTALIPDTIGHMSMYTVAGGFETTLTRKIPKFTTQAVRRMFDEMLPTYASKMMGGSLSHDDFDWALHPGGEAIINGVQETMQLSPHQLRATREIYRTRGNSSSPTVLIVLDKLRTFHDMKDEVVATSFGPGLAIEMAFLKRCRGRIDVDTALEVPPRKELDVATSTKAVVVSVEQVAVEPAQMSLGTGNKRLQQSDSSASLVNKNKCSLAKRFVARLGACSGSRNRRQISPQSR